MRVLIGCEESQAVTIDFRKLGHEAFSCDLLPCSGGHPEWHYQMDVFEAIKLQNWDMGIFFPDCTYLTCSAEWAYKEPPYHQKTKSNTLVGKSRIEAREKALRFVCDLMNCDIPKIAIENPIGVISSRIFWYSGGIGVDRWEVFPKKTIGTRKPDQIIQPYQFGDDASKSTCLWLKNLPKLKSTNIVKPRIVNGKKRYANQTDSGQNNLSPSENRSCQRSKTYPGIARAMAEQWGE